MSLTSISADRKEALDTLAVNNFREYLQIPSVHPDVNYDECVKFLEKQAGSLGLPYKIYHCTPGKPIVIITWVGEDSHISSILLNSHMDVVPVFEKEWKHKPFAADSDEAGNIYARGTQDMKSVGIQYLEAVRRLLLRGVVLKRTIHMSFAPDEEIGGAEGWRKFVHTDDFKNLNVGFALDEGMASPDDNFVLFYAERCIWYMHIHCPGQAGHGSLLHDNTAGEKVNKLLNKFFEFRTQEKLKLDNNPQMRIGDVTTVNLTRIYGGVQSNVVPNELTVVFDCRIPITVDIKKWEQTLDLWCKEAGAGVWIEYQQKLPQVPATKLDHSNQFWLAFKKALSDMELSLVPQVFPGGTDSRYIRGVGLPALGFSPINNTPVLLHDNDEFLNEETFLKGIDIYFNILNNIANVEDRTG